MQKKLLLNGTVPVIIGIILMLLPIDLFFKVNGTLFDLVGYALMALGLYMLNQKDGGFKFSTTIALICAGLCLLMLLFPVGHLAVLLPLCAFCALLYFMCTRYAILAHRTGDCHMEHHFISHMWIDITVTAVEIIAHALGIHGILYYIIVAVDLYCEAMLLILMWQFYKKHNGDTFINIEQTA